MGDIAYVIRVRTVLLRDTGACLSPFNSFLILQGLETLPLRMERHSGNALAVAEFLKGHDQVDWVSYPGFDDHPAKANADKYLTGGYGAPRKAPDEAVDLIDAAAVGLYMNGIGALVAVIGGAMFIWIVLVALLRESQDAQ